MTYITIRLLTFLLLTTAASALHAQGHKYPGPIDWKPVPETELYDRIESRQLRRYSIALNPSLAVRDGLKVDFEMELRKPGQWLQFSALRYRAQRETFLMSFENFNEMWGFGIGVGYKAMLLHRGLYFNAAVIYSYFDLERPKWQNIGTPVDGLMHYERKEVLVHTRIHEPRLALNVGKYMALGRHAFFDIFVGLGYARCYLRGDSAVDYGDGLRGVYPNFGLRLGVLWHTNKK